MSGPDLIKEAEAAVKTSFFKWKPDWEAAAELYDKAGLAFRLAKDFDAAVSAYRQAAAAHSQLSAHYHAAKALENAAGAARDQKKFEISGKLMAHAAKLYRQSGSAEAASTALTSAAKEAERLRLFEQARTLFLEVVDVWEAEDQLRRTKIPLEKAIQMTIRESKFQTTLEILARESAVLRQLNDVQLLNRNCLGRIIVNLQIGDFIAAERIYEEANSDGSGFVNSDEQSVSSDLLDAYDVAEQDQLSKITRRQIFSFMSNDIAVLARNLRAQGGTGKRNRSAEELPLLVQSVKELTVASKTLSKPSSTPNIQQEHDSCHKESVSSDEDEGLL